MKNEMLPKLPVVRAEVREYAQYQQSLLKAAVERGENPYQLTLDMQDIVDGIIQNWSDDEKVAYLNMLTEETNAITNILNDQTAAINQANADQAVKDAFAFEWVVAIVLGLVMLVVFYLA